jgi:hypothetical protein
LYDLLAILPSWLLIILVLFAAFKLATSRQKILSQKPLRVISHIVFITLAVLALALVTVYFTYKDSISFMSCRLGLYGRYVSPVIVVVQGLIYYFGVLKQSVHPALEFFKHKSFVYAVLLSNVILYIVFWRAVLLCTG